MREKLINAVKNFVAALLVMAITLMVLFYGDWVWSGLYFMVLLSVGVELYQVLYTGAEFNVIDVGYRFIGAGAGWQLFGLLLTIFSG